MNRLRFGILDDKLMAEQTKQAVRCIEKRCKGVKCSVVGVKSKDVKVLIKMMSKGKIDAVALKLSDSLQYLTPDITVAARIRDVDNRYVLMTRRKSGKYFANALVASPEGNVGAQLQGMFDGVTCVETGETLGEQVERLLEEKCDGVIALSSDVINSGYGKMPRVRYKHFDSSEIVQQYGDGVIAVLTEKSLPYKEILGRADNKRITRELEVEEALKNRLRDRFKLSVENVNVRARIDKDKLEIYLYVYKEGVGAYFHNSGKCPDKEAMLLLLEENVRKFLRKSNVF